jgi:hypothetical protein
MQPGDVFQTNYGAGWGDLHEAEEIVPDLEIPGAWHITAITVRSPGRSWPMDRRCWFSGYRRTAGGRLLGARYKPGTAGWESQIKEPPWNTDGFDEIRIVQRAAQMSLF